MAKPIPDHTKTQAQDQQNHRRDTDQDERNDNSIHRTGTRRLRRKPPQ